MRPAISFDVGYLLYWFWFAGGDGRPLRLKASRGGIISGDGGLGQYAMELTTAVKYNMNITHVLLNNGALGNAEQRAGSCCLANALG